MTKKHSLIALIVVFVIVGVAIMLAPRFTKELMPQAQFKKLTMAEVGRMVEAAKPKATLVNIWASWCDPCREELPMIVDLSKSHPDLNVILITADSPDTLNESEKFLQGINVPFDRYVRDEDDADFVTALYPNWSGAIPVTLIYNRDGQLKKYWQGAASKEEFEHALKEAL